ncbi:hypothetical protein GCM10027299_13410 [Larkinella ripae]
MFVILYSNFNTYYMRRVEISDFHWQQIAFILPGKLGDAGRTAQDNRLFINAILWIAHRHMPWRDLPERFGSWNSIYRRFKRWMKAGVWKKVNLILQDAELHALLFMHEKS